MAMSENPHTPGAPAAHDVVEIFDRLSATRMSTTVESANDRLFVLRLEQAAMVPEEAAVRWYDGATAWQAIASFEHIDHARVSCRIVAPNEWEPTPIRHSLRAPVDSSTLVVRIVSSSVLARGRRVHAVCLDISETGCRASWPGRTPRVGDAVDVAWDLGDWHAHTQPGWVPARVARIIPRPFGARQLCFMFETADSTQAARIRAWYQAWLHAHRQRTRDQHAA
jgi:hypothetical protein